MKKNMLFIALLIISAMILSVPAYAHDDHDHDHDHKSDHGHTAHQCLMAKYKIETGGFLMRFKKELSLTHKQYEQLKDMSKKLCERMHDRKEDIRNEKAKLKSMLRHSNLDLKSINKQMKKIYDMEYSFKTEALAEFQKARKTILTTEQKNKLEELLRKNIK